MILMCKTGHCAHQGSSRDFAHARTSPRRKCENSRGNTPNPTGAGPSAFIQTFSRFFLYFLFHFRDCLGLPQIHNAAVFHRDFSGLNKDMCRTLKTVWERDLECELNEVGWKRIAANSGKYIRGARGVAPAMAIHTHTHPRTHTCTVFHTLVFFISM